MQLSRYRPAGHRYLVRVQAMAIPIGGGRGSTTG